MFTSRHQIETAQAAKKIEILALCAQKYTNTHLQSGKLLAEEWDRARAKRSNKNKNKTGKFAWLNECNNKITLSQISFLFVAGRVYFD